MKKNKHNVKKPEIAHESEHKALWITWKIKHLKFIDINMRGIYFQILEVILGRQYFKSILIE